MERVCRRLLAGEVPPRMPALGSPEFRNFRDQLQRAVDAPHDLTLEPTERIDVAERAVSAAYHELARWVR